MRLSSRIRINPRKERWVIKTGSNIVCSGGVLLLKAWMHQVAVLRRKFNVEVIWVTSGAIASATERTGFEKRNRLLSEKQALSAIGQPMIMDLYNTALQSNGLMGAQILLTRGDLEDKTRLDNFKHSLEKLLQWGVIPVLNENDVIATEEIQFGDNDSLSARVAHCSQADRLVILTDVKGLYDSDPRKNTKAKLVRRLPKVSAKLLASVTPASGTERGTGGMYSKLSAAKFAAGFGIPTCLAKGDHPQILIKIADGNFPGTLIEGETTDRARLNQRVML